VAATIIGRVGSDAGVGGCSDVPAEGGGTLAILIVDCSADAMSANAVGLSDGESWMKKKRVRTSERKRAAQRQKAILVLRWGFI